MFRSRNVCVGVATAVLFLAGCTGGASKASTEGAGISTGGGGGTTVSTSSPPLTTSPRIFVTDYDTTPITVVALSSAGTMEMRIPGYHPAVDGAGNLYVVGCLLGYRNCTSASINVYSPDLFQIVRSLPVGSGTKIPIVNDFTVSTTGEIFVNDGNGIAVFSPTANGDVDPVRRIAGQFPAAAYYPVMTIDGARNLYVPYGKGTAVFGPNDTGTVGPSRVINVSGQLATDSHGNLYVLGYSKREDGLNPFGVTEYAATASGDAVPLRYITTSGMDTTGWNDIPGIAVDATGIIYVSATFGNNTTNQWGGPGVWEFAADASGSVAPLKTLTWTGENNGGIAVQ